MLRKSSFFAKVMALLTALTFLGTSSVVADQTIVTPGGDDEAYQIPDTTIVHQGTTYNNVYITTNSVLLFGSNNGTEFNQYPNIPMISFNSIDWVQYTDRNPDEHLIIRTFNGGFQIDIAARPYPNNINDPLWNPSVRSVTSIIINASIDDNGVATYTYSVEGEDYSIATDFFGNTQRTGGSATNRAGVVVEGAAGWPSYRVTRVSRMAANYLVSAANPSLELKDGFATCTPGKYKFATGGEADIKSVVYTLYVDGVAKSRVAIDGEGAVVPHMFAPISQELSGVASLESATWNLAGHSNFNTHCEVTVLKQGSSLVSNSATVYDAAYYAAQEAKAAEAEKARQQAVVENFTKEARDLRKRIRARESGN